VSSDPILGKECVRDGMVARAASEVRGPAASPQADLLSPKWNLPLVSNACRYWGTRFGMPEGSGHWHNCSLKQPLKVTPCLRHRLTHRHFCRHTVRLHPQQMFGWKLIHHDDTLSRLHICLLVKSLMHAWPIIGTLEPLFLPDYIVCIFIRSCGN